MSRGHGAIQLRSPEMGEQKLQNQSTDEGTVASMRVGNQRHSNKRNLDYVLKSGLCGGLAGCAVCTCSIIEKEDHVDLPRRPKPSLDPSIVSRSFSRLPTLSSRNIQVLGWVL